MVENIHPSAPSHLPWFITAPGETDVLMVATGIFILLAVLAVGNIFLRLHTLPERLAHKSQKLQFEIVAVLGLLALGIGVAQPLILLGLLPVVIGALLAVQPSARQWYQREDGA